MVNINSIPIETQTYFNKAKLFASDIIDPKDRFVTGSNYQPYYGSPRYYHYDSGPSFWNAIFPQRHRVDHYHHTVTSKDKKKKSNEAALMAGMALMIAGGMVIYSVGKEYGKHCSANEDLKKLYRDKEIVKLDLQFNNASPMTEYKIDQIFTQHEDILQTYKNDADSRLVIKGATFTGLTLGATTCIGTWLESTLIEEASPYLTIAAMSLTGFGALAWAFKAGFDQTANITKAKAQDLLASIQNFQMRTDSHGN